MRKADNLTTLHVPIVLKYGNLNLLELSGTVQACSGIALRFTCVNGHKIIRDKEVIIDLRSSRLLRKVLW